MKTKKFIIAIIALLFLASCQETPKERYEIFNILKHANEIEKINMRRYDNGQPVYMQDFTITVFTSMESAIAAAKEFRDAANFTGKAIVESMWCEKYDDKYTVIINCYVKNVDLDLISVSGECLLRKEKKMSLK